MTKEEILRKVADGSMSVEIASALLELKQPQTPTPTQQVQFVDLCLKIHFLPGPVLRWTERFRREGESFYNSNNDHFYEEPIYIGPKGIHLHFRKSPERVSLPGPIWPRTYDVSVSEKILASFEPCGSRYFGEKFRCPHTGVAELMPEWFG